MDKLTLKFVAFYFVIVLVSFYVFFGPGIMASYEPLNWKGLETYAPGGFEVKTFKNRNWDVYSLYKLWVHVEISIGPAMDVERFSRRWKKTKFTDSSGQNSIYALKSSRKLFDVLYVETIGDKTVHFKTSAGSVYAAVYMMKKLTADARLDGVKLSPPDPSIPTGNFITDIIFAVGIALPLFLIIIIFRLAGLKPADHHFKGEAPRLCEHHVSYSLRTKRKRKNSSCYLALTSTRFMVFQFKKPVAIIDLKTEKSEILFEGNSILLDRGEEKLKLTPKNIGQWKAQLSVF
ncbi:MAG: hypothetical protein GY757_52355 [bacterium]|nr:hypothetical protein [bacterium]